METVTRGGGPTPQPSRPAQRRSRDTVGRLAGLAAAVGAVAYVGLADPGSGVHPYPACPSRLLLGLDCPACGGLRGTHDLLHGDRMSA